MRCGQSSEGVGAQGFVVLGAVLINDIVEPDCHLDGVDLLNPLACGIQFTQALMQMAEGMIKAMGLIIVPL